MFGFEIEVRGLNEQVQKLERFDAIAGRQLLRGMERSLAVMASKILPNVPIGATKGLFNSMGSEITQGSATSIVGRYGSSLREAYPQYVESGRPAMTEPRPMASDLFSWVQRKLGQSGRNAWRTAGIVAWRVYRFGTKGQHFMADGLKAARPMFRRIWQEVGEWIVKDLEVRNGR